MNEYDLCRLIWGSEFFDEVLEEYRKYDQEHYVKPELFLAIAIRLLLERSKDQCK